MMRMTRTLLYAAMCVSVASSVRAGTITAASCSAADVQAALNRAAAGDTVVIPAGTCTWTSAVSWNAPPNVTVKGAGDLTALGGGDVTVIIDSYPNSSPLLSIQTNAAGTFRLAGITFKGGSVGNVNNTKFNGIVQFTGSSHQMRIDHVHCDLRSYTPTTPGRCFRFIGWMYGVIDKGIYDLPPNQGQAFQFANGYSYDNLSEGDGAWAAPTSFGSSSFFFVEDNTFSSPTNFGTAQDCYGGGKQVWRYNTHYAVGLQTHPTGGSGRGRGCRASEIYGNTFYNVGLTTPLFNVFFISSGTAVVWGNVTPEPSEFKHFLTVHSMRRDSTTYPQITTPNGWGYCGTSFNGTGSNWDQNTSTANGYPCLDQPGRGRGDLLTGQFPNVTNRATACGASQPCASARQAPEPIYLWGNPFTPMPGWGGSYVGGNTTDVAENRDLYVDERANCPRGGTSCSTGVGVGTLAQRPSTCTAGVAWWAQDQGGNWNTTNGAANDGALYTCTTADTWSLYYVPYTYPHPLTRSLQPPTNIVIR